jgi:hypothetical protein
MPAAKKWHIRRETIAHFVPFRRETCMQDFLHVLDFVCIPLMAHLMQPDLPRMNVTNPKIRQVPSSEAIGR